MKKTFVILFLSIVLFSCKKVAQDGKVTLKFNHIVADKDLSLNTEDYLSPTNHPFQVTKLWYYVSAIEFVSTDANNQRFDIGHLVKASDEETHHIDFNLKAGNYEKIIFQFGFSNDNNKDAYIENTQDNQLMAWPTQLGPGDYHYMKFEGKYDSLSTGVEKSFIMHAGPTNGNDNSFQVSLDVTKFKIDDNMFDLVINMDLQEWLQNPTAYNFPDYSMVMMNQNTQEIYKANGASVFSFKELIQQNE